MSTQTATSTNNGAAKLLDRARTGALTLEDRASLGDQFAVLLRNSLRLPGADGQYPRYNDPDPKPSERQVVSNALTVPVLGAASIALTIPAGVMATRLWFLNHEDDGIGNPSFEIAWTLIVTPEGLPLVRGADPGLIAGEFRSMHLQFTPKEWQFIPGSWLGPRTITLAWRNTGVTTPTIFPQIICDFIRGVQR